MVIFNYNDTFVSEPIEDIPLTPFEYESLCRGFEPDWEARYSIVYVDGWHYVYRSGFWLKKLKYELGNDGFYHITEHYSTQKELGNNVFSDHVLYEGYFEPKLRTALFRSRHKLPPIHYQPKQIGDEKNRFALFQEGTRTLYVIGLNPSTADESKGDPTMKKVLGFARCNGFDGFGMFNLCPIRATLPDQLPHEMDRSLYESNLNEVVSHISASYPEILVAFGDNAMKRDYMLRFFRDLTCALKDKPCKYYQIGTLTKKGMPRHPLYESYSFFNDFQLDGFLRKHC